MTDIHLEHIDIQIIKKKIKKLYLSVHPPYGQIRVSAPISMPIANIHAFIWSQMDWIKTQQNKIFYHTPQPILQLINNEIHFFKGKQYLLKIIPVDKKPYIKMTDLEILLHIHPNSHYQERLKVLDAWYRQELNIIMHPLFAKWEKTMGLRVEKLKIQKMRTKWGSCTPKLKSIRINLELIKKPSECLEYVIVHELAHLIEPSHNRRFKAVMDKFLPNWRQIQKQLNY